MLARHSWRKAPPTRGILRLIPPGKRPEKKLPDELETLGKPKTTKGRRVRVILQEEARLGRMRRTRRCEAQALALPTVNSGEEREFTYVKGAVSPLEGEIDWIIYDQINTERLGEFLGQVSASRPHESMVMIVDGANSPVGKASVVPENDSSASPAAFSASAQSPRAPLGRVARKSLPQSGLEPIEGLRKPLNERLPKAGPTQPSNQKIGAWPQIMNRNLSTN
jgi:hypothetical protein